MLRWKRPYQANCAPPAGAFRRRADRYRVSLRNHFRHSTRASDRVLFSLRGQVLPIGCVKEKATAAERGGVKTVMLPARNKKDLDDIPESARNKLKFHWLETVDDALVALCPKEAQTPAI